MEVKKNKDYYINRVRDSFLKISGLDLDTYLRFPISFLDQLWTMNGADVDLTPFLSLFLEFAEWDDNIFVVDSSSDRRYSVTANSGIIHPEKIVDENGNISRTYTSIIKSPFGEFFFDKKASDLIKKSFHGKLTRQTSDDEIRVFFDEMFFRKTQDNQKGPTDSWYKLLNVLIYRNYEHSWEIFAAKQYEKICYDLVKSVTLGEYFILDIYCAEWLDNVLADDTKGYDSWEIEELKDRIKNVVSKVWSFSKTISFLLLNQSDPASNCPFYVEGFKKHIAYSYRDSTLKDIYDIWSNVIEAVIAIAYIDFFFVSTPENVETLGAAYKRLKRLGGNEEITEPNMAKALLLLQKCMSNHTNNVDDMKLEYKYIITERGFQKLITEFPVVYQDIKIDYDNFPSEFNSKVDGHSDITDFNNIHCRYRRTKQRQKRVSLIVESGDYSEDKLNSLKKALDEDIWTVSLLTSAIVYISGDGCSDVKRKHLILSSLLDKLKMLAELYDDERLLPGKIVRPFIQCYYTVNFNKEDGKYHIDEQKGLTDACYENTIKTFDKQHSVFIISILPTPVFINFLKLFIKKYDIQRICLEKVIKDKSLEEQLEMTEQLKYTKQSFDEEKGKTLQLLGILGSFIAFVSLAASSLNDVTPELFLSHMLVCSSCIALLILLIFFISLDNKWPKWILTGVLLLYIFISMYFSFPKTPHTSDNNQTTISMDASPGTKSARDATNPSPAVLTDGDVTVASETQDTVHMNR